MLRLRRWNVQLTIPVSFHLGDQHQAKAKITIYYTLKLIEDQKDSKISIIKGHTSNIYRKTT